MSNTKTAKNKNNQKYIDTNNVIKFTKFTKLQILQFYFLHNLPMKINKKLPIIIF